VSSHLGFICTKGADIGVYRGGGARLFPTRLVDLTLIQDGCLQCKVFHLDNLTEKYGTVDSLTEH